MDHWEISVRLPARLAELAATLLTPIADGAAIELPFVQSNLEEAPHLPSDAAATVRAYVPAAGSGTEREALRRRVNRALQAIEARARLRRVRDQDWVEACKASFPAMRIGERLLIRPHWDATEAAPDDIVIELEPGVAFGTGDHPTTRACLELTERLVRPGGRVLDLGCGSGILAIAAARLGAAEVWALDIDPFAVDAATANVERNGLASMIRVALGSVGEQAPEGLPAAFALVLANLASGPLIALAGEIASALAPGGHLVASGVIAERLPAVERAFAAAGLGVIETIADGDWRTCLATRRHT